MNNKEMKLDMAVKNEQLPKVSKPKIEPETTQRKQAGKIFGMDMNKKPNPGISGGHDYGFDKLPEEEQGYVKQFKSLGFNDEQIHKELLPSVRKSIQEDNERERIKNIQNEWERKNAQKPLRSSQNDMDKVKKHAIKEFGLTDRFNEAFYMLPDGKMLNGTGGGGYGRRALDHRDIGSAYTNANVDVQETEMGSNSHNMMDFMRNGNIRIIPEANAIDLMAEPTDAQMNMIYRLWRQGKIDNIQISDPNDKYGQQLDYLEDIQSERQIADLMKKHYWSKHK